MRHIAILLVLILGVPACRPSAEPEELAADQLGQTELADRGPEDVTATPAIGPSRTPIPSTTDAPPAPSAPSQLLTTRVSSADPSGAALMLRVQAAASTPSAASGPTSILFVSTRDGVAEIYRMNEDGTGQIRLTQNGRNNEWPGWSPDGQHIGFLSSEVGAEPGASITHLFVMEPDGTGAVELAPSLGQSILSLNWSPESQRIAFVANPVPFEDAFAGTNVFVVNRDGSGLVQITQMEPGTVGCGSPTWSPDGSKLAFICRALMNAGIVIANADGTDSWGFDYYSQVFQVFWLPSGEHVGFTDGVCWSVGVFRAEFLLTHGASGSVPWPCLNQDFEALGAGLTSPYAVTWSPLVDTQFAVQTTETLQIIDLDRYAVTVAQFGSKLLSGPPSWSPDGVRLAFAADGGDDSEIFVLNLANNEVVQLTDNEVDDYMPAWQP